MRIKNWDQFQHYKTGKNAAKRPEWIKLYTRLLDDIEFDDLDGKDAKALVKLWALASEMEGELPSIKTIAFRLRLSEKETISILGRLGHWVEDVPRTEEEREEESEENKKEKRTDTHVASDAVCELDSALDAYNLKAKELQLSRVETLNPQRRKKLSALLKARGIQGWLRMLQCLEAQPFLLGESSSGWRANFDFLVRPSSFQKVVEMAYARGQGPPPKRSVYMTAADELLAEYQEKDKQSERSNNLIPFEPSRRIAGGD